MGDLRAVDGASRETDNVKRRAAWLEQHPGASIETDDYDWHVARDAAGIMLGRRPDLADLMNALEGRR